MIIIGRTDGYNFFDPLTVTPEVAVSTWWAGVSSVILNYPAVDYWEGKRFLFVYMFDLHEKNKKQRVAYFPKFEFLLVPWKFDYFLYFRFQVIMNRTWSMRPQWRGTHRWRCCAFSFWLVLAWSRALVSLRLACLVSFAPSFFHSCTWLNDCGNLLRMYPPLCTSNIYIYIYIHCPLFFLNNPPIKWVESGKALSYESDTKGE